jgi:hypothetical protein
MDNFELKPEPKVKKRTPLIWNLLTILTLLGACCLSYYFFTVYSNPNSPYNPFPPVALPTRYQTITPANTVVPLPSTWTPTLTNRPYPSRTKAPTWTLLPKRITSTITETPTTTLPEGTLTITPITTLTEGTLTITPTPISATAEFTYQASTTMHADSACDWMGVGGKVFDADGKPLQFLTVNLGGSLEGKLVDRMMLSGNVPAYGTSGFEFILGNHPVASTQQLWIQLFDNTGKPLTEKISFDTYDDCNKNLVMIVFTKTR